MAEVPKKVYVDRPPVVCRARFANKTASPKTLRYFPFQSLGEVPRLLLEYTETPYDSVMYFLNKEREYKEFALFGQLPCYEGSELGEGQIIAQSSAICRHIARQAGIAGASPMEQALQDMLWEAGKDMLDKKNALHSDQVDDRLDSVLQGLIKLQKTGKCLGTGNRSSNLGFGEIGLFHALYMFHQIKPKFLAKYPELLGFMNAVAAVPAIDNYLHSPRRLPMMENELGKGIEGIEGYTYVSDANPATFAENYQK